jgi:hypothetical protein
MPVPCGLDCVERIYSILYTVFVNEYIAVPISPFFPLCTSWCIDYC